MVLFNTIDIYTAIMLNWLSVACVAQWVEHIFLSSALLVRIPYSTFIILTSEKTINFIKFSPFAISFLYFNLITLVTTTFSRRICNTIPQLSPVISSVFKI